MLEYKDTKMLLSNNYTVFSNVCHSNGSWDYIMCDHQGKKCRQFEKF